MRGSPLDFECSLYYFFINVEGSGGRGDVRKAGRLCHVLLAQIDKGLGYLAG